ncbi:MAG TPA: DUF3160 domain-containing protein [Myxococcales bacterium]|jgi:hypothetical protein
MLALAALVALTSLAAGPDACAGKGPGAHAPLAPVASRAWDKKTPPARLDRVAKRFALSKAELDGLAAHGFVVPARLRYPSYAWALHEVYQSQLPLYVSVDAILHAVFATNDQAIAALERERLAPLTASVLATMQKALAKDPKRYPSEVAGDLDVYLSVARQLLEAPADAKPGEQVASLVKKAADAAAMDTVELFGRSRTIDFTQLAPRGHYAGDERLERYFRAAMWLARLEFNLVSRSCRSSQPGSVVDAAETPREAVDALALADLAERSGAMKDLELLDEAWSTLAGRREDVSLKDLLALRKKAGIQGFEIPKTAEVLRAAIGTGFKRTLRTHYMPEGTTELPAIATMFGPRIVADATALMPLLEPATSGRYMAGAPDVAYALGHDRALAHLDKELKKFPELRQQLDVARAGLAKAPAGPSLYAAWLAAIRAIAATPKGEQPSFAKSEAFADLRVGSTVAAFGQLRHNYVLMAGQAYDQGGCEIPDGYVDPAVATYEALAEYAEVGLKAFRRIDPSGVSGAEKQFRALAKVLQKLEAISVEELAGRPLSPDHLRWLNDVIEMSPGSTGAEPRYSGWYFNLFPSPLIALDRADFIADFQTSGWLGMVSYAGVEGVRMGVFVIDTGGKPRVVVGPVTRSFWHQGLLARRLNDETARELTDEQRLEPWAKSYAVAATSQVPALKLSWSPGEGDPRVEEVAVAGKGEPVEVTLELMDHHRVAFASQTRMVGAEEVRFRFELGEPEASPAIEMIHVHSGAFDEWVDAAWSGAYGVFGGME